MSHSNRIRLKELRQAQRLLQECCELGHDPPAWHRQMLVGLLRLLGGAMAASGVIHAPTGPGDHPHLVHMAEVGSGEWLRYRRVKYIPGGALARSLTYQRFGQQCFEKLAGRTPAPGAKLLFVRSNEQLFSRAEWERSHEFNEIRRPTGLDDQLTTCHLVGPGVIYGWALHRGLDGPPFGRHERRLLYRFHQELARHVGAALCWEPDSAFAQLPERLRQTLFCLLEGDAEKQAAAHLGLSRHTVHDYVTELYQRFGVHSRPELVVQCLRRQPNLGSAALARPDADFPALPPRLRQTLGYLLQGENEQQVAGHLGLSRHTVHEYVTGLYQRFGVSSSPELLLLCLRRPLPGLG